MRNARAHLFFVLMLLFFGVFFLWPLAQTVWGGFVHQGRPTLVFLAEVFRHPIYREGLLNSFGLAVTTTLLVATLSLPLALLAVRFDFPGKAALTGLVLAPMILPPFVGAIGIRQILGPYGALNALLVKAGLMTATTPVDWLGAGQFWAVAVTEALHLYPVFYLNVTAALANIDPAMEEAAQNLGCSGWRRFRRITLPLAMPGVFAGSAIVFIWSFTELGTPLMFDYTRVTAVQIFDGLKDIGGSPFPYALTVVMLTASVAVYALSRWTLGRKSYAMLGKGGQGAQARALPGFRGLLATLAFLLVFLLAALPHIGVILGSVSQAWYRTALPSLWTLDHYGNALGHSLTLPSIRNSLVFSALAMGLDLLLGLAIAVIVVRSTLRWRGVLDAVAMLPLAVPGIVVAFGYIAMCQPGRLLASLNPADNPTALLIMAYAIRRLPYVVRSIAAGLQQTSVTLEEAAQNLGCPPARAVVRITLPLIAANIIAGGLLAFSFAMLEVSDSLMLAQKQMYFPITKALYELSQILGEGRYLASALGVWAMAFLLLTILGANRLLGRRLGAIFRM